MFTNEDVRLDVLKERAFNMRWAEVKTGVIPLTAADPDFPAAPEISKALIEYIKGGYFPYVPNRGLKAFKESISRALAKKDEIVDSELILPIDSAARGMDVIAKTVLRPGDEAIVFDPVDFLFKTSMENAGAKIVLFPMKINENGNIDFSSLEDYITPKTKMIGLCNPHNPLGKTYPIDDLDYILSLSEKHGFYIMNDEIWSDIVYSDSKFISILSLGPERNRKTVSVYGFSKGFGIAGLRAGCVYCQDEELFEKIVDSSNVDKTIGGISSLSQIAGIACLDECSYWVKEFVEYLQKNRDYAVKRLNAMPGIVCNNPEATFVLFPDITETGKSSEEIVNYLKEKKDVFIVPGGSRFFGPGSEGHVRICIATSRELLIEALDRIEQGIRELENL